MRRALLLAAGIAVAPAGCAPSSPAGSAPAETGTRYLSIGADALATAQAVSATHDAHLGVLAVASEVAVISFDAEDLEALSEQMHAQHGRCGGFIVHDSLAEALAWEAQPADRGPGEYTIDQPATVQRVLAALDRTKIVGTIRALSEMPNRYFQSPSGQAASTWLRDVWRGFTPRADVTVELFDHGWAQRSVVMTIPGTTRAHEVVVIGGHLDSIAPGGKSSTAPGADDDASGIATLTEVARALLASDYRPARTLKLIAYAAEEVGLRGSQGIVRDHQHRKVNVVGVLQLDMTNHQGSEKDIWLLKDFTNAAQNTFVANLIDTYVGATYGFDACGYACSDHASWYRAGVPASMPFESRMAHRNKKIHTRHDTLETSDANAAHALKFARLGAAYAIELAKGELGTAATATVAPAAPAPPTSAPWRALLALATLLALGLAARAFVPPTRS